MLFNSIDFGLFLPIVFILYWFVFNRSLRLQNALIVAASYVFYGWWDWRFLLLILFSSIVDYSVGLLLTRTNLHHQRKLLVWGSVIVNLGLLGFFKYYNFFVENFVEAFSWFGVSIKSNTLNVILPVGISFYTFQTMSYTIDVYKKKLVPTKDFIAFSAFVSFFPQLVAGPIERATHLLPQFYQKRVFEYNKASDGLKQILWGLFKKVVIADQFAQIANYVFSNSYEMSGSMLLIGAIAFTFQIYGDFSGYSDIAIGTSRLFGFDLMQNFAFPYFSRDIAEFWRRWHISLSTWFRDYLYIPLGGSKGGSWMRIRNTFIIFIVSGFWHGANWTFIIWGILNAIYFLPLLLANKNRKNLNIVAQGRQIPTFKEMVQLGLTFTLTVLAWVFFRAENVQQALSILKSIFSSSFLNLPSGSEFTYLSIHPIFPFILLLIFLLIEWFGRNYRYGLEIINKNSNIYFRWSIFYVLIVLIIYLSDSDKQNFIYFQF